MPSRDELKEIIRNSGVLDYEVSEDKLNEITDDLYNEDYGYKYNDDNE